ncbi:hypothetical protein [Streptomyces sp. H51]|uniref:hypothetical protein n=1 Tax=Streptomyces sp. H51 TaxID=3111770 RepID=UPI002D779728|nr:hypothetical protein [Streptomyces sp. H51]
MPADNDALTGGDLPWRAPATPRPGDGATSRGGGEEPDAPGVADAADRYAVAGDRYADADRGGEAEPEVSVAGMPGPSGGRRGGRSRIAAIGERVRVAGLTAAGVDVYAAEDPPAVRAARERIPADVGMLIMTPAAAAALGPEPFDDTGPLTAVMPS